MASPGSFARPDGDDPADPKHPAPSRKKDPRVGGLSWTGNSLRFVTSILKPGGQTLSRLGQVSQLA